MANFLRSCLGEITLAMRAMGRASLRELNPSDLCALDPEVARWTGVELGLYPPVTAGKSGRARLLPRRLRKLWLNVQSPRRLLTHPRPPHFRGREGAGGEFS